MWRATEVFTTLCIQNLTAHLLTGGHVGTSSASPGTFVYTNMTTPCHNPEDRDLTVTRGFGTEKDVEGSSGALFLRQGDFRGKMITEQRRYLWNVICSLRLVFPRHRGARRSAYYRVSGAIDHYVEKWHKWVSVGIMPTFFSGEWGKLPRASAKFRLIFFT